MAGRCCLDLYWIPLGAGATVVRRSGRAYEALLARWQHRAPQDLYHSALVATTDEGRWVVEMTPIPRGGSREERGVVGEGAVGSRWLGGARIFRYEIRRWLGGEIPDLGDAVGGPIRLAEGTSDVHRALDLVAEVPTPVWGRDELQAGEMWNSNSVVSWVLARAGLVELAGDPPGGGRAPGWNAGVVVAARTSTPAVA